MLPSATALYASRASRTPAASRSPICQLASCTGRDPRTTACEDATTTASHTAADATRLQIRLSPSCKAAWVRDWPTHPGVRIRLTGPGAHTQVTIESAQDEIPTTTVVAAPTHPAPSLLLPLRHTLRQRVPHRGQLTGSGGVTDPGAQDRGASQTPRR
ncbi:DUF2690 domain-containing protein [Streptomyces sp. NPDC056785]|uniref:DUF2690 domain-containing protein n=1 Tax=Streptomyces sp. NPDC056785 TaxID=3345944 RepID=UPI0036A80E16